MSIPVEPFEHLVATYGAGERPALETRVLSSPWGTPSQRTALPYGPQQIDALLKLIERPTFAAADFGAELQALRSLGWVRDGQLTLPRSALLRQIGRQLYEALFPRGPVRTALNVSLSLARRARAPLPFRLHLDHDAGNLARLPWELLGDDQGYLVRSGRLTLARHIAFKAPLTSLALDGPLRVLVVVSRPRDLPMLDGEAELTALRGSLGSLADRQGIEVQLLSAPVWPAFVNALTQAPYHIVHFDGHGDLRRRCPACHRLAPVDERLCSARDRGTPCGTALGSVEPRGYLAFERHDGGVDWRSAENLAAALFRSPEVRLVVLSACRSASVGGGSLFGGIAPALIGMGVPAVVAMQSEVPLYATVSFAEAFYASVAARRPLVDAIADARANLDEENWYRPALYLRGRGDPRGVLFS